VSDATPGCVATLSETQQANCHFLVLPLLEPESRHQPHDFNGKDVSYIWNRLCAGMIFRMEVAATHLIDSPALTALSHAGGCGRKLAATELLPLLQGLPGQPDPRLLVGPRTRDDAAVFLLRDDLALVQTVDFFTPLVDDPYDFGRIAAANALSDIYAMGAEPLTAMNIVGFPIRDLGRDVLQEILRGGADVAADASTTIVGGHTINDNEPKYGLAVTGLVDPARMTTNSAGHDGDLLVLSKPLGTGAIVTAHKRGERSDELLNEAVKIMVELNDHAAQAAVSAGVRAMTDVTGFGLLGHLHNLALASGLAAEIHAASVPMIEGAVSLLESDVGVSSGTRGNLEWAAEFTDIVPAVELWQTRLLADATTSGGLLAAVPAERASELVGVVVGRLCRGEHGTITVH
jgi:selenide,water dikinase